MNGKILLVDDSGLARAQHARRCSSRQGYDVVEAEDGIAPSSGTSSRSRISCCSTS